MISKEEQKFMEDYIATRMPMLSIVSNKEKYIMQIFYKILKTTKEAK